MRKTYVVYKADGSVFALIVGEETDAVVNTPPGGAWREVDPSVAHPSQAPVLEREPQP